MGQSSRRTSDGQSLVAKMTVTALSKLNSKNWQTYENGC